MDESVRRRLKPSPNGPTNPAARVDDGTSSQAAHHRYISPSDIIRTIATILAISLSMSYYLTSGDSLTFNYRPWFTRPERLGAYFRGPLHLTPTELSLYNGTAHPQLPILLSINRTIFDVSASPHTYGPGGSYNIFAGRDATRAFVTGCFQQDLTGDLRGVERMYLPVEDEADNGNGDGTEEQQELSSGEWKIRAEQEKRQARKRVRAEVDKWVRFYREHGKYFEVGTLVGVNEWASFPHLEGKETDGEEVPELCDSAEKARPKRSQMAKGKNQKDKPPFRPKKR